MIESIGFNNLLRVFNDARALNLKEQESERLMEDIKH